jgi:hypothetical protein
MQSNENSNTNRWHTRNKSKIRRVCIGKMGKQSNTWTVYYNYR